MNKSDDARDGTVPRSHNILVHLTCAECRSFRHYDKPQPGVITYHHDCATGEWEIQFAPYIRPARAVPRYYRGHNG